MNAGTRLYRLLLRLLPRHRRLTYGDEMTRVFFELRRHERRSRGRYGVAVLWLRELAGMLRFALRARAGAPSIAGPVQPRRPELLAELRWAWRGVRGRGWTAALSIGLVAVAISANAVVFSTADSLVFTRVPYPDAGRLVGIENETSGYPDSSMSPGLFAEWGRQTDVLAGIAGYQSRTAFLAGGGPPEYTRVADVSPGFFEVLGVHPRWGRSLTESDLAPGDE
jgi:hypothetical protein